MSVQPIRTKAKKRTCARREAERRGTGDPALGWDERKRRAWVVRTLTQKQGGRCAICGEQMNRIKGDPRSMTVDHIEPKSRGGGDEISNLQLACKQCNHNKGDAPHPTGASARDGRV